MRKHGRRWVESQSHSRGGGLASSGPGLARAAHFIPTFDQMVGWVVILPVCLLSSARPRTSQGRRAAGGEVEEGAGESTHQIARSTVYAFKRAVEWRVSGETAERRSGLSEWRSRLH
jgi:hypothetical protein